MMINMKATKQVTDSKGTVWTIFHAPIGIFDDYHEGRNSLGYKTSFHTRSGALKWLKRNTEVSAH
jgi:hypothetical protein